MSAKGGRRTPLVADRRYGVRKAAPAAKARAPRPPRGGRRRTPPRRPRGLLGWLLWPFRLVLRVIWGVVWRGGLAVSLLLGLGVAYYAATLPPVSDLVDGRARGSVTLLDRAGEVFAWRGEQFGGMIMADQISPTLRDAVIATEDKRFWWHPGLDPQGIASAMRT